MSERRFIVQWRRNYNLNNPAGWVVFDNKHDRIITIAYASYAEAELHRDTLARHYLRMGW